MILKLLFLSMCLPNCSLWVYHPLICLLLMNLSENKKNLRVARQKNFKVGGTDVKMGGDKNIWGWGGQVSMGGDRVLMGLGPPPIPPLSGKPCTKAWFQTKIGEIFHQGSEPTHCHDGYWGEKYTWGKNNFALKCFLFDFKCFKHMLFLFSFS